MVEDFSQPYGLHVTRCRELSYQFTPVHVILTAMSYHVLARKWRPQTYADVVGQQAVMTALANGFTLNRLHHAYLFSGTRGVGKTTIARLVAKGLNCHTGITPEPCGQCAACSAIEQGGFVDLLEIDAASRTKVEDTRDLLENVQYLPASGRFKVYLIDEVHMLSRHSFNALLKTLEEPPEHAKFLLATTDPQKLPLTILSRCLHFHLQPLPLEQIRGRLEKIARAEHVEAEEEALQLLSFAADGSLRDALSLMDQAIAMGGGKIAAETVTKMLGQSNVQESLSIIEALHRGDGAEIIERIERVAVWGCNWHRLLIDLAAMVQRISMVQLLPSLARDLGRYSQKVLELSRIIQPQDLQLYYQILLIGRKELPLAPDQRMGVEMTMLRALAFHPQLEQRLAVAAGHTHSSGAATCLPAELCGPEVTPSTQVEKVSGAVAVSRLLDEPAKACSNDTANLLQACQQLRQKRASPIVNNIPNKSANNSSPVLQKREERTNQPSALVGTPSPGGLSPGGPPLREEHNRSRSDSGRVEEGVVASNGEVEAVQLAAASLQGRWSAELSMLSLPKMVEQLALNSTCEYCGMESIRLYLRSSHRHLNTPQAQLILRQEISKLRGNEVVLEVVESDDNLLLTPLELRRKDEKKRTSAARGALQQDPNIRILQETFDAQIDEASIQPKV